MKVLRLWTVQKRERNIFYIEGIIHFLKYQTYAEKESIGFEPYFHEPRFLQQQRPE